MRVLDWMQKSNSKDVSSKERLPMKKDTNALNPSKSYQKQAPLYASIDDMENTHMQEQKPGSRPGSGRQAGVHRSGSIPVSANRQPNQMRQEVETQREFDRQHAKLSSHSATGYDMEQRHRGVTSRPYSRQTTEQRREIERRPPVNDPRPGSQVQRRANTFSYPNNSQFQPPPHQNRGGDPRSTTRTTNTGPPNKQGYPATKYTGRDYYVLDV